MSARENFILALMQELDQGYEVVSAALDNLVAKGLVGFTDETPEPSITAEDLVDMTEAIRRDDALMKDVTWEGYPDGPLRYHRASAVDLLPRNCTLIPLARSRPLSTSHGAKRDL